MFAMKVRKWWRGDEVRDRLIAEHRAAIRALAYFVADRARFYCPYDHSKPPGELHLRDTIQVISEADGSRHHVFASAPWAEPVEFGHTMPALPGESVHEEGPPRRGERDAEFHRSEPGEAGISSRSTDGCHVPMTAGITPGRR
jgi:hypothetical protein